MLHSPSSRSSCFLSFFLAAAAVQSISGINTIDTIEPIIRNAPVSLDSNSYFGFSAVLHRVEDDPQSFGDFLDSTRWETIYGFCREAIFCCCFFLSFFLHYENTLSLLLFSWCVHHNYILNYLSACRIVVSAPNGTAMNAMVNNTGVLYTCPVQQGECTPLRGNEEGNDRYLYDELG